MTLWRAVLNFSSAAVRSQYRVPAGGPARTLSVFAPTQLSISHEMQTIVVLTVVTVAATALVDPLNNANGIGFGVLAAQNVEN